MSKAATQDDGYIVPDHAPSRRQAAIESGSARVSAPADGVILVNGTDLKPEPISWLWTGWLARGKFHMLAGPAGVAKTTIAASVGATTTTAGRWPDGSRCEEPGNVVIWSGEDDPADTLLPRFIAAGADPARVYFITGVRMDGETTSFDPARDLVPLMAAIERIGGVRLLIVDPVVNAVAGDSHKNTEVRRALQPLVEIAAATGAAVLGISHFAKAGQGIDPTMRVIGSVAFAAVARVVMVAAKTKNKDGEPCRILARSKSNIGPDEGGFEYHVEQAEALPGIQATRIVWGEPVEGTARELLAEPDHEENGGSAKDTAADFLRQVLGDDVVPVKSIEAEARAAGVAWRTIRRAADTLCVIKRKGGMDAGWYWSLPKMAPKMPKGSNVGDWTGSASSADTFDRDEVGNER